MEKDLLNLIDEYITEVDEWNTRKKLPNSEFIFEDDLNYTFENFIKWLGFRNKCENRGKSWRKDKDGKFKGKCSYCGC